MQAEFDHLGRDRDALSWAVGCVVAAAKERVYLMLTSKLSRVVVCAEMLVCFVPLTIAWVDAIGGGSGVIHLNGTIIHRYFLHTQGGYFALATLIAGAVVGIVGPLGLAITLQWVVSGRVPRSPWFRILLIAGPATYGALMLATRVAVSGLDALEFHLAGGFDFWSGLLLLAVLPAFGAAHLYHLGSRVMYGRFVPR